MDAHALVIDTVVTSPLATHATMTTIIEMTGMTNVETIDMMAIEMTETMNADITDVTGVTVIFSGLGDNSVSNSFTPADAGVSLF